MPRIKRPELVERRLFALPVTSDALAVRHSEIEAAGAVGDRLPWVMQRG